jgi:hypothetical protein
LSFCLFPLLPLSFFAGGIIEMNIAKVSADHIYKSGINNGPASTKIPGAMAQYTTGLQTIYSGSPKQTGYTKRNLSVIQVILQRAQVRPHIQKVFLFMSEGIGGHHSSSPSLWSLRWLGTTVHICMTQQHTAHGKCPHISHVTMLKCLSCRHQQGKQHGEAVQEGVPNWIRRG